MAAKSSLAKSSSGERTLQSSSVVGERRIGKSSLLYHLAQTPRAADRGWAVSLLLPGFVGRGFISEDSNDAERELLCALAAGEAAGGQVEPHQAAWQSLGRKEIVEMRDDRYRFAVELFRLWILKNQLPAPLPFEV